MKPWKNKPDNMDSGGYTSQTLKPQEKMEHRKKTWDEEIADLFPVPSTIKPGNKVPISEESPRLYRFWDVNKKYFFLMNNILVANHQDSNEPELFMEVFPNTSLDPKMQPIFMGPEGRKQSLSCVKSADGQPQLEITEVDIKDLYKKNEKSLPFTLYSKTDGGPQTCSFESAEFPGTAVGAMNIVKTCPGERMEMIVEMKPKKSVAEEMADLFHAFPNPKDTEELLAVTPNQGFENNNSTISPIFMGLQDGERVLSCVESGAKPEISIVEENIMKLYKSVQPFKNFTFLNHTEGDKLTCSLESAAFRGWFLSTSTEPNKPIALSRKGGAEIATFYFNKK